MKRVVTAVTLCILAATAWAENPDFEKMLFPCVRVRTASAGGSGTIIYSEDRNATGEFETYILTNHHVIDNAITVSEKWDSLLGKMRKREELKTVQVERFDYDGRGVEGGRKSFDADIMAYNEKEDLALLKLRSKKKEPYVASMLPRKQVESSKTALLQRITAVGCQLGNPPVVTRGEVTSLNVEIDNRSFWMISASIIFGSSGGSVFLTDSREFIGVPARVQGYSWAAVAEHLGFAIPIPRIYDWFEREKLSFLYDETKTPKECFAARKALREKAKLKAEKE